MADGDFETREYRRTEHPGGLKAASYRDDLVLLRWEGESSREVEIDVLRAIVAEHGPAAPEAPAYHWSGGALPIEHSGDGPRIGTLTEGGFFARMGPDGVIRLAEELPPGEPGGYFDQGERE